MSKHVLIAGGAGFLGSHLTEYFLNENFKVTCVDNLITGRKENLEHYAGRPEGRLLRIMEQDICNPINIDEDIDYILNFASPASPIDYLDYPIETLKVGSYGTHNLLELARKKNAVFLQASTSEVYGDPKVHPQPEEYWGNVNPIGPRSVYDEAKRFSEALTMAYHTKHGLDTKIVRIFNTYGPRMRLDDGRVVPTFIDQAIKARDLTVFGNGSQTRSFCYVSDEVSGIVKLLFSNIHEPVNIGNPSEMSILDFAKKILEITGTKSKIIFKDLPVDDPKVRRPDITKAKEVLNWEPVVTLEKGLQKTIESFR